ncbi:MAG: WD40 repeat domain-containing protein [Planctomycetota bacterium]
MSPDHTTVVAATGPSVAFWNVESLKPSIDVARGLPSSVRHVVPNPEGTVLVTCGRASLHLWDVESGEHVRRIDRPAYISDVCWASDGQMLAIARNRGESDSAAIELIDPATAEILRTLPIDHFAARGVATSPDGRWVAGAGGTLLYLWDAHTGKLAWKAQAADEKDWLGRVALSPDGRTIAVIVHHRQEITRSPLSHSSRGSTKLFKAENGEFLGELSGPCTPTRLAFTPDSKTLLTSVTRYSTGQPGETVPAIVLWDVSSCSELGRVERPNEGSGVEIFSLSATGTRVLLARSTGVGSELRVGDLGRGSPPATLDFPGYLEDAAFMPDGKRIVTANENGTLYLLRLDDPADDVSRP